MQEEQVEEDQDNGGANRAIADTDHVDCLHGRTGQLVEGALRRAEELPRIIDELPREGWITRRGTLDLSGADGGDVVRLPAPPVIEQRRRYRRASEAARREMLQRAYFEALSKASQRVGQAEREELVKRVFPALRKRCEQRGDGSEHARLTADTAPAVAPFPPRATRFPLNWVCQPARTIASCSAASTR